MNDFYGYVGTFLEVNLSKGTIKKTPLDEDMARNFIGGVGFSSKIVYDLIEPGVDPLAPGNVFAIGSGPLSGTLAPTSGRAEVVAKSPLSGFIGWANTGWSVACMLKYAGYDHLAVTGAANKPVYIMVSDDSVEIRDASHLWGKDSWETTDALQDELGKDYWVTCIGPAGERLVRFASTISNRHSVGARTGIGAVLGSKKLKAIAVRGTKGVKIADRKRFLALCEEADKRFKDRERLVLEWRTYGWLAGMKDFFNMEEFLKMRGGYYACPSCPVACNAWMHIREGKYAGLSELMSAPGTKLAMSSNTPGIIEHYDEVIKMTELINKWGMDYRSAISMVNLANRLFKEGIITERDTEGAVPATAPEAIQNLVRKIAYREGFGDILAEGMKRTCAKIGKGADKFDASIRGVDADDVKGGTLGATETFGFATSNRGGYMDRSTSISFRPRKQEAYIAYCKSIGVPEEAVERVCQGPQNVNPPRLTRYTEDMLTLIPCQGLCRRPPVAQVWDINLHAEFYSAATGIEVTPNDLLRSAERVWNLQRCFNIREGITRKDDRFPNTLLPMTLAGITVDENTMDSLLNEYYEERGWDVETGKPTKEKLVALGLENAANELKSSGLIK